MRPRKFPWIYDNAIVRSRLAMTGRSMLNTDNGTVNGEKDF